MTHRTIRSTLSTVYNSYRVEDIMKQQEYHTPLPVWQINAFYFSHCKATIVINASLTKEPARTDKEERHMESVYDIMNVCRSTTMSYDHQHYSDALNYVKSLVSIHFFFVIMLIMNFLSLLFSIHIKKNEKLITNDKLHIIKSAQMFPVEGIYWHKI